MVKNTNKVAEFTAKLAKKKDTYIYDLSSQVLADSNRYARKMSGDMIATSYVASDLSNGKLVWNAPYAAKVYYEGSPNTEENPNAQLMWCEYARTQHKKDWLKILANSIKENVLDD